MERKVLHRDVSANNILIYPKHCPLPEGDDPKYFVSKGPIRFIDDVLSTNT